MPAPSSRGTSHEPESTSPALPGPSIGRPLACSCSDSSSNPLVSTNQTPAPTSAAAPVPSSTLAAALGPCRSRAQPSRLAFSVDRSCASLLFFGRARQRTATTPAVIKAVRRRRAAPVRRIPPCSRLLSLTHRLARRDLLRIPSASVPGSSSNREQLASACSARHDNVAPICVPACLRIATAGAELRS